MSTTTPALSKTELIHGDNEPEWCKDQMHKQQLIKDPNTTTVRADGGKPMVDLLPPKALLLMAQVLTRGADKYGRVNWQPGMAWSRCYASCLRHLFAWWSGETNDPETGLNHLAHAACNILFLLEYTDKGTGTDDRIYNVK